MTTSAGADHAEIRDAVAKLCRDFPGEYWRALDRERAYPTAFVERLTKDGFLSVLIPEEYDGSGLGLRAATAILEEIHRAGCNGAACHAQMYTMGALLRHGSAEQKARYLPKIASGELRLQAFGVTEPTSGTDTTRIRTFARREGDRYIVNGQKIWISRAEHSDLMLLLCRTTPREEVEEDDRRHDGAAGRHARGDRKWPHDPAHPHHAQPRDDRALLRQYAGSRRESHRRGEQAASAISSTA